MPQTLSVYGFLQKHELHSPREVGTDLYEYSPVIYDVELLLDLESMKVHYRTDVADNPQHRDHGQKIVIFTLHVPKVEPVEREIPNDSARAD